MLISAKKRRCPLAFSAKIVHRKDLQPWQSEVLLPGCLQEGPRWGQLQSSGAGAGLGVSESELAFSLEHVLAAQTWAGS